MNNTLYVDEQYQHLHVVQFTPTMPLYNVTRHLPIESRSLTQRLSHPCDLIEGDKKTEYYTGLPSWALFLHILSLLTSYLPIQKSCRNRFTPKDELFIVLSKLRLNLMFQDLAYRYNVSKGTMSRMFHTWINLMYAKLSFLIVWPSKDVVHHNMPLIFKQLYPKCRCIIDCTEIFIQRPFSLKARAQTYCILSLLGAYRL